MWWQERSPGGRLKGIVFLLHPGPSLLVSLTFVAVCGLALRAVPDVWLAVRLICLMLPIQFAIGVFNDVADVRSDAASKPYKPLVRGVITRRAAGLGGASLAGVGLGAAATINVPTLLLALAGLGAGLLYDIGLRRTPLSFVPWCVGITVLPVAAYAAAGRLFQSLLALLPLSLLIALCLHCANALPDIGEDRVAARRSLPVLLGRSGSRVVMLLCMVVAGGLALTLLRPSARLSTWLLLTTGLLFLIVAATMVLRLHRPFPPLALGTALFAVSWLGQLTA